MALHIIQQDNSDCEIVERKGLGHPDTLSDHLAERLSCVYSQYTLSRYGAVLHHNFDKVGLMGGQAKVNFGGFDLKQPIRVLLNGRASCAFHNEKMDLEDLLITTTKEFLASRLHGIDPDKNLRILFEVSTGSSPGAVGSESGLRNRWFAPESLNDLSELRHLNCNDTSLGAAFYHRSPIENCVYSIEQWLNSEGFKAEHRWIGCDIKIMGFRKQNNYHFTMAIPQIADRVASKSDYRDNKECLNVLIREKMKELLPEGSEISLDINTRDNLESQNTDLYLTGTGSSIEMGDEGFVGRGNRIGGLITPFRPYSMEGICGKNPIYHTGKMYSVAAWEISKHIWDHYGADANVMLIGQSGQALARPWNIMLSQRDARLNTRTLNEDFHAILDCFDAMSQKILTEYYVMA